LKFKVGDFWWTKNGKALMLILSKTNKHLLIRQIFPLIHKEGNRHTFKYTLTGKYSASGISKFDLHRRESDNQKILKAYLGIKEDQMQISVGEFWWTKDGLQLLKIIKVPSERRKTIHARNHIPNGYVYRYDKNGRLGNDDGRSLYRKETDSKKIMDYYKDPEHTWR